MTTQRLVKATTSDLGSRMARGEFDEAPGEEAPEPAWCGRNWHDGTCCPGSIRQWHLDRDLLPPADDPEPGWERRTIGRDLGGLL